MIPTPSPEPRVRGLARWRRLRDPLILAALASFAITQPLLSDFRAGAGFFVARRSQPVDIVLLAVTLTVVPGLVAALLVWIAGRFSARAGSGTRIGLVWLFAALTVHTALVRFSSWPWPALMAISGCVGVVVAIGYVRSISLRSFLTYVIPAPLIFLLFFIFAPPVADLIMPPGNTGAPGLEIESPTPVVFVIFDELPVVSLLDRDGELDSGLFPNFAELASQSTWFKYTASVHDNTLWAVPALLSARAPNESLLPIAASYPGNLFTLVEGSYEMNVVEPFTDLCRAEVCGEVDRPPFFQRTLQLAGDTLQLYSMMLTPDRSRSVSVSDPFNEFLGGTLDRVNEEAATDQVGRFDAFLDGVDSSHNTLHFAHLFLPHSPFHYYPSGRQYNSGHRLEGQDAEIWVDSVLANQAYQRHLLQLQVVDDLVGDLLDALELSGVLDEALIVVTADHGVSFELGTPRRAITEGNAHQIGLIPLFIKAPHQEKGAVDVRPARTIDVLPTVAEILGVDLPWEHDGQSLLGEREVQPLEVESIAGGRVLLEDVERGLAEVTPLAESVFTRIGGDLDLFALGEFGELVGTASADLSAEASDLTATVENISKFAHVDLDDRLVPGFVHGQVFGDVDDDLEIALVLEGEIQTIAPVFEIEENRARFSAILPDRAFVDGFNYLGLLALSGTPRSPLVRAIDLQGLTFFQMETSDSGRVTALVDDDGRSWPVRTNADVIGAVDTARWREPASGSSDLMDLELHGWALDESALEPADTIVFFANQQFAGSIEIAVERPDIRDLFGSEGVLVSGFSGRLPQVPPIAGTQLRAFALAGDIAVEIGVIDSARAEIDSGPRDVDD